MDDKTKKALEAKGFVPLSTQENIIHFFQTREGAVIRGIPLARFEGKTQEGETRMYWKFRLTQECKSILTRVREGDGNDWVDGGDKFKPEVGDVVRVNETASLKRILGDERTFDLTKTELFIMVKAKMQLGGGRSFWPMDIYMRDIPEAKSDNSGEDIPF